MDYNLLKQIKVLMQSGFEKWDAPDGKALAVCGKEGVGVALLIVCHVSDRPLVCRVAGADGAEEKGGGIYLV